MPRSGCEAQEEAAGRRKFLVDVLLIFIFHANGMAKMMNQPNFVYDGSFGDASRFFNVSQETASFSFVSALAGINVGFQQQGKQNNKKRGKKLHLTDAKTVVERITWPKVIKNCRIKTIASIKGLK